MRAGFLVAVACALLMANGPAHAEPECAGSPDIPYDIELVVDTPTARIHHDRSIADLGRLTVHGPGSRILGLAKTGLDFGWYVGFESVPKGEGFCLWVARVRLTARHASPDIYVARKYRRGGCQYRAVLAHERQHIRASRELINRYRPRLNMALTSLRIPTGRRPVYVTSREEAKAKLRALMADLAEPVYREMTAQLAKAQATLDSPASYRRLFKMCQSW